VFGPVGLLIVMDLAAGRASTFSQVEKAASPIEILAVKSHRIFPSWFSCSMLYSFPLKIQKYYLWNASLAKQNLTIDTFIVLEQEY
jgi:hypothetical protein